MNSIDQDAPETGAGHPIRGERVMLSPRAHMVQRLQVGAAGLASMALLVALASIIMQRAKEVEASTVPEAAATVAAGEDRRSRDPLVDAGVVPAIPQAESSAAGWGEADPLDDELLGD